MMLIFCESLNYFCGLSIRRVVSKYASPDDARGESSHFIQHIHFGPIRHFPPLLDKFLGGLDHGLEVFGQQFVFEGGCTVLASALSKPARRWQTTHHRAEALVRVAFVGFYGRNCRALLETRGGQFLESYTLRIAVEIS